MSEEKEVYNAKKFDPKGGGLRFMLNHKSRKAEPPKNVNERAEMATRMAKAYAAENRSDPFAFAIMHSRVMNGLFDEIDMHGPMRISV